MFNEHQLKAIRGALFIRLQSMGDISKQHTEQAIIMYESTQSAMAAVDAMLRGDMIVSVWTIEDVQSLRPDCDMVPTGGDNEHTYYCDTHQQTTSDPQACDAHEMPVADDLAREALAIADDTHDASIGINWDVLQSALETAERERELKAAYNESASEYN